MYKWDEKYFLGNKYMKRRFFMSDEKVQPQIIIVAPHPDDEIIGCYKQLSQSVHNITVIYSADLDAKRKETVLKLREKIKFIKAQLFLQSIPQPFMKFYNRFYFPDPIYEVHPKHREWVMIGESMARQGFNVTFYNTIMNAQYIYEVLSPESKKALLDEVYPDQKSLWEYDHKYFLFEGYNKWIF